MTNLADTTTRRSVRIATFLPAIGLMAAAAAQIDAAVISNAYRGVSPAPEDSLNFPWHGELAGQIHTWWAFGGLFLVIGLGAFARTRALAGDRAGRVGGWVATVGAAVLVVAQFLAGAHADALEDEGVGGTIGTMFGGATLLLGVGLTIAGIVVLRSGTWRGVPRFVPLANGVWPFVMIPLILAGQVNLAVGILSALHVALGAALIAEES